MNINNILLRHNYIAIPPVSDKLDQTIGREALATIMMNLSYYGYALDIIGYQAITSLAPNRRLRGL